jgi:hypothetical protein
MKTITLKYKKTILLISTVLLSSIGYSQSSQLFTTSGSFTAPAGVTSVKVEAWGGGGKGGSRTGGGSNGYGGGGGGAYAKKAAVTVTPGVPNTVVVGTGATTNSANGLDSYFINSTTVLAKGGTTVPNNASVGGAGGAGSPTSIGDAGAVFAGGKGANGVAGTYGGGGGSSAGTALAGTNATNATGAVAPLGGGNGANGAASNGNGTNAVSIGGGGGGALRTSGNPVGGNGADGQVLITWTCPTYALTSATTATGPFCGSSTSTVTLRSSSLTSETYTVTYNLSGSTTAIGNTATMTFTAGSPGTGTFNTSSLNGGTTNITITNIASGACNSPISSNNTASVLVVNPPTANAGTNVNTCANTGAVNITAGASVTFYTAYAWTSNGTGTFTNPSSVTICTYTPSAADISAGSVTLTLTVTGTAPCSTATSSKTLTILPAPTAVAGTAISTCSSAGAVNITTGSSATNQTSVTWTSSGTGTFVNPNSLTTCTYTPSAADATAGSVILTLTATGNAPCSNAISTKTLTITNAPTAVAGSAIATCSTSGAVNITTGSSATNYASIAWTSNGTGTFVNPTSLTTCTYNPSIADKALGTVTLTLTVTGNTPCGTSTDTKTLTIFTSPTAVAGTAISTCSAAGAVNITAGSSATNQTSVTWSSSGTGTFANATSLTTCTYTPSVADITAGSVTLTLTSSNAGCTNATDTKILTITPSTPASISISASATTICAGTNVTFTATPTNGGTTPAYQWKVNGANVGTNSTTYSSATLVNGNTVTCVLTSNATPCLTGSPATSNTVTMTVNPAITASVSISASATTICAGTNATFTAVPTNGGATPSYQWKVNGTNVGTNSATYSSSTLSNSDAITCIMTASATPCLSGSPATSNTITMTVNPYLTASVSVSPSATTICSGTSVTFTATATNGGTTPAYQWILNGTNVGTNSTTYTSSTLTNGDQVICVLTSNAAPCLLGSPATSNTVTMTVNTTPTITSSTPGSRTGTGTVVLGATASTGATVFWYNVASGGGPLGSGTTFTTPSIAATTTYYAVAVAGSGCASTPRTPVVATIYAPEIDIQGNLVSIVDGDTTPVATDWSDFTAASSRTFTILNTGGGILNIGAITFTGTNASEFTIVIAPNPSVAAGDSTSFTVQFAPTAAGLRTATINIVNDDANENPYDFKIQGTGTAQEMNVQGNATDIADGDTTPTTTDWTDFSNLATTRTFTIQNLGSITLTVGAITFSGTNPGDFSVITAPSATVAGRSTTTFVVKFTAGATGVRSAIMSIANNDSNENPYNFTIQGNTTSINMNVKAAALLIADGDTTPSSTDWTDFGTTNVSSAITRTYTIENTGTTNLLLSGTPKVALTGSTDFSVTTQPASPVGASSTTTFVVTFNPTSTGTKNASISIANNDAGAGKNPYTFDITGTGLQAYTDSDGDGVFNNLDTDDDNDGIPDNVEQSYASGSVLGTQVDVTLLNETFGTGITRADINDYTSSATTTYCWEDGTNVLTTCDTVSNGDCDDGQYTVFYQAGTLARSRSYPWRY